MLHKAHRLPALDIPRVMKHGTRVGGNGITLIFLKKGQETISNKQFPRFTFIVSTKVDKRATVRNRVRRLMSESVRHMMDSIRPEVDGIFIGSQGLVGLDQKEMEMVVRELLGRAKLLNT